MEDQVRRRRSNKILCQSPIIANGVINTCDALMISLWRWRIYYSCLYPFFGPRSLMNPALTGSTEPCLCEEFTIWLRFPKTLISWTCYLADTKQAAKQWRACAPSQFCQISEKGLYSWAKLNRRRQVFFLTEVRFNWQNDAYVSEWVLKIRRYLDMPNCPCVYFSYLPYLSYGWKFFFVRMCVYFPYHFPFQPLKKRPRVIYWRPDTSLICPPFINATTDIPYLGQFFIRW